MKFALLPVLILLVFFGCKKIEDPTVGKWKTGVDFAGFHHVEEIGCEIEFKADGTHTRVSDDELNIQVWNRGEYVLRERGHERSQT